MKCGDISSMEARRRIIGAVHTYRPPLAWRVLDWCLVVLMGLLIGGVFAGWVWISLESLK